MIFHSVLTAIPLFPVTLKDFFLILVLERCHNYSPFPAVSVLVP